MASIPLRIRFKSALTPVGFAVLAITLIILIRSLSARNAYEILLSSAALLILLALGILGAWKSRQLANIEPAWKPPLPWTANTEEETLITGLGIQLPCFFRLHFIIQGRFYPSSSPSGSPSNSYKGSPVFAETSVSNKDNSASLVLDFPMSGLFQGEGFCRLRDIFGFYSFPCGKEQSRFAKIRSAPCAKKNFYINAHSGAEDRRNKISSDEERYYMREYAPGDRFRDINWKSSERIDTLITRISPDNQEKVSRIEVIFRNYNSPGRDSLEALWLLDRAKARLSQFLRTLKEEQANYIFCIHTAQGDWDIETQEELEEFLEELSALPFAPNRNEVPQSKNELYIFSTACDSGLHAFLGSVQSSSVFLFLVQPALSQKEPSEIETLHVSDFPAKGCIPSVKWLFPKQIKALTISAHKTEITYAKVRL